jgi:hypothetical protein
MRGVLVACLLGPFVWPAAHWVTLFRQSAPEREQINSATPCGIAPSAAKYLVERTRPEECILVIGSEPDVYYYADRNSCARLVFAFPLTGPHSYAPGLLQEFRADFQTHQPRYVVLANVGLTELPYGVGDFLAPLLEILDAHYVFEMDFKDDVGGLLRVYRLKEPW